MKCCEVMDGILNNKCDQHCNWDYPDNVIMKMGKVGYFIPVKDGGRSFFRIYYCPFCGEKL